MNILGSSSGVLNSSDREKIKRHIPKASNKILDETVARLYIAYPDDSKWTFTGLSGAITFVDDLVGHTFFLKLVDVVGNQGVLWDQELYVDFQYNQDRLFFHSFELDDCYAGLLFEDKNDAQHFYKRVIHRQKYGSKATLQNKKAIELKRKPQKEEAVAGPRGDMGTAPGATPGATPDAAQGASATYGVSQQRIRRAKGVIYYDNEPPAEWRSFYRELESVGISEDMIAENRQFIKDYIAQKGGPLVGLEPPIPRKYQYKLESAAAAATSGGRSRSGTTGRSRSGTAGSSGSSSQQHKKKAPPPPPPPPSASLAAQSSSASIATTATSSSGGTPEPHPSAAATTSPAPAAPSAQTAPAPVPTHHAVPPAFTSSHPVPPAFGAANAMAAPATPVRQVPALPSRANGPVLPSRANGPPPPPPSRGAAPPAPPPRNASTSLAGNTGRGPPPVPPPRRGPAPPPSRRTASAVPTQQYAQQPPVTPARAPVRVPVSSFPAPPQRNVQSPVQPTVQMPSSPPPTTFSMSSPVQTAAVPTAQAPSIPQAPPPPPMTQATVTASAIPAAPPLPTTSASSIPQAPPAPPMPVSAGIPAPPPPPPPPPMAQPVQPAAAPAPTPVEAPSMSPGRDALLASIRGAGIGSLKKTNKTHLDRPSVILQEANGSAPAASAAPTGGMGAGPGQPGSLADALAAALSSRKSKVAQSDDEDDDW